MEDKEVCVHEDLGDLLHQPELPTSGFLSYVRINSYVFKPRQMESLLLANKPISNYYTVFQPFGIRVKCPWAGGGGGEEQFLKIYFLFI